MKHFVVVAGNIGVGKSSLVERLSQYLQWEPLYEAVSENPYLADFYQDMPAWSFQSQIFFLSHRLRTHRAGVEHPNSVLQDRSVYEDAEVFACNLHRQGHMRERDYQTYRELYRTLVEFLPPPDLIIYLRANVETLLGRIQLRGRDYERQIAPEYLMQLNMLYEEWIVKSDLCPVLTVPADQLDFIAHPAHLDLIAQKMTEKLQGKDEVVFNLS